MKPLWDAVNIAKDVNIQEMPPRMFYNDIIIGDKKFHDEFAFFFKGKVQQIVNYQEIDNTVLMAPENYTPLILIS